MVRQLLYFFNHVLDKRDELVDHWDEQTNLSKTVIGLFAAIVILVVAVAAAQMLVTDGDGIKAPTAPIIEEPEESIIKEPVITIQEPEVFEPTIPETITPSEELETPPAKTQEPYREHTIIIEGNLVFEPAVITVNVGDVVIWKNNDFWGLKTFPIYSDEELWDVMNVAYNENVSYVFTDPGHFKYHSYKGMEGEVVVVQT